MSVKPVFEGGNVDGFCLCGRGNVCCGLRWGTAFGDVDEYDGR